MRTLSLPMLVLGPLLSIGCGRPATVRECEEIVERITALEVLSHRDASTDEVHREVAQAKLALHERMMKECVGRRIRDEALECVRHAKTSEEATACFE